MPTERQIQANRRNAQKSTGPRSAAGKAVSRLNALKTGIHAKSEIIPGERPADLDSLTAEYHDRFRPATPEQRFLVDTLVHAEWQLRRSRRVEAQLWKFEIEDARPWLKEECPLGHAFSRAANAFSRLQRRIDSAGRAYHRALQALQRIQSDPTRAPCAAPAPEHAIPTTLPPPQTGFVPSLSPQTSPPVGPAGPPSAPVVPAASAPPVSPQFGSFTPS